MGPVMTRNPLEGHVAPQTRETHLATEDRAPHRSENGGEMMNVMHQRNVQCVRGTREETHAYRERMA